MMATEIHTNTKKNSGDFAPLFSTISKQTTGFKHGRESLEDDLLSGQPKSCHHTRNYCESVWYDIGRLLSEDI